MKRKSLGFVLALLVLIGMIAVPVRAQDAEKIVELVVLNYNPVQAENAANSGSAFNAPNGTVFDAYYWDVQQNAWVWARFQGNGNCQNLPSNIADRVTKIRLISTAAPGTLDWYVDIDCKKAVLKLDFPVQAKPTAVPVSTVVVQPTAIPLSTTTVDTGTQASTLANSTVQTAQNKLNIRLCGTGWPTMVVYSSGGVFMLVPDDQHQDTSQPFRITSIRLLGGNRLLQFSYLGKVTPGAC